MQGRKYASSAQAWIASPWLHMACLPCPETHGPPYPLSQFFSDGGSRAVDVAGLERPETINHFSVAANVRSIRLTLKARRIRAGA